MRIKLTALILLVAFTSVSARTYGQKISLSEENAPLSKVLHKISRQSGYEFLFFDSDIKRANKVSLDIRGEDIDSVLKECFQGQPLSFEIVDKTVVVKLIHKASASNGLINADTTITVHGRIADEKGNAIPGASIRVRGTNTGTITSDNGTFILKVPRNAVLDVSVVGFSNKELDVLGREEINGILTPSHTGLNDVVIVAYGTQKRNDVTGAVTTVKAKDLVKSSEPDLTNQLTGRAPGVRVLQLSSQPGQFDSQIDIRGFNSTPLFVIDGVPRDLQTFQMLDPNEIASISVLKDATSSIYGVEAANGVVLVTTKKGANHPIEVNYTVQYGKQFITHYPGVANAYQYATLYDENQVNAALSANTQPPALMYSPEQIEAYRTGQLPSTNWTKAILNSTSHQSQQNINVSGGSRKFQFFLSGGFFNQGGLLTTNMEVGKKYNLRSDITAEIAQGLKLDVNLGLIDNIQNEPSTDFGSSILKSAWRMPPVYSVYSNNDPHYYNHIPNNTNANPVALIDPNASGYNYTDIKKFTSTFTLDYLVPFVDGLSAKAMFAYDNNHNMNKHFTKQFSEYDYDSTTGLQTAIGGFNGPSKLYQSYGQSLRNDLQFQLNYGRNFGKHNLSVLALYEQVYNQNDGISAQGNYVIDALDQLSATDPSTAINGSSYGTNTNRSYVGKFNYDYSGKYLLEAGFREEGSSYFPSNSRWGFFPYVSAGWNIAREPFIKNNATFINNLKLRASIGKEGDDQGAASSFPAFSEGYTYPGGNSVFGTIAEYRGSVFGNTYVKGIGFKNSVNPNITWYTSTQTNIGLDATLWNGKLTFSGDIFRRDRNGLLATPIIGVPGTYGISLPPQNINSDRTEGFEISLSTTGRIGNVTYIISPNMSFTRTEWLHYEQNSPLNATSNYTGQLSHRWSDLVWGYKVIGQFQDYSQIYAAPDQDGKGNRTLLPGDYEFADVNHDGVINSGDKTVIATGNAKPLIYFASDFNVHWENFDVSLLLQGATMYHQAYQEEFVTPFYFADGNPVSIFTNRWHQENIVDPNSPWVPGKLPSTGERAGYGFSPNTATTYNASYLRVKSLEIAYTFQDVALKKIRFRALRIFINAYDLYTFTGKGLKFIDPEYSASRDYSYNYPITMNTNIGAQVTF